MQPTTVPSVHPSLTPGSKFPDIALPDPRRNLVKPSDLTAGRDPLAVVFYRGYW